MTGALFRHSLRGLGSALVSLACWSWAPVAEAQVAAAPPADQVGPAPVAPKLPAYHHSVFSWEHHVSTETVGIGDDPQSSNPTYTMGLSAKTRYYLQDVPGRLLTVRLEAQSNVELGGRAVKWVTAAPVLPELVGGVAVTEVERKALHHAYRHLGVELRADEVTAVVVAHLDRGAAGGDGAAQLHVVLQIVFPRRLHAEIGRPHHRVTEVETNARRGRDLVARQARARELIATHAPALGREANPTERLIAGHGGAREPALVTDR